MVNLTATLGAFLPQVMLHQLLNNSIISLKSHIYNVLGYCLITWDHVKHTLINNFNNVPRRIGKGVYEIDYLYNDQKFTIVMNIDSMYMKRVYRYRAIKEGEEEFSQTHEITKFLEERLGPNEDCSGSDVTPKMLGFQKIEVMYMGDELETLTKTFSHNDQIKI